MTTSTGSSGRPGTTRTLLYVAYGDTLQIHRLSLAQAFRIVKISSQRGFLGEKPARPADQEDEHGQGHRTDNYGYPDL